MPITFEPILKKPQWAGSSWTITDDDALAKLVAQVALGQSHYALRVLKETGFVGPKTAASTLPGAIALLTATNPDKPFHRDGWLFQIISWIAAHLQEPNGLIMEPHMIHAHKGFDGVHVRVEAKSGEVETVVICEEKATKNARKMVVRIWDEFEGMEKGNSDHRLMSEVMVILKLKGGLDVDRAVEKLIWNNARAYRVAITTKENAELDDIFEGYGDIVAGQIGRRRGEVLPLAQLRPWMEKIASKARTYARAIVNDNV